MAWTQSPVLLKVRRLVGASALALTMVLVSGGGGVAAAADAVVYGDSLATGWQNWSWGSAVNFNGMGAFGGSRTIHWTLTSPWGGLYLHAVTAVQTSGSTSLQFALWASRANQRLSVSVYGDNAQQVGFTQLLSQVGGDPPAAQWKAYSIPLSSLGAAGKRITGVVLQDATGGGQPSIAVDEIKLTQITGGTPAPPAPPAPGPANCLGVPAYPEVRPGNSTQNLTRGRPTDPSRFPARTDPGWRSYYERIDGNCTGSTEQILEWAAKKWGFDQLGYPDLAKAMAVLETFWNQAFVGNHAEVGILQVRPEFWPDWEPAVWSTAYAADYAMAVVRSIYDGASWLGSQTRGNIRDSVAAWYCGCPYDGWNWYATTVFGYYDSKPWQRPGQPPAWF